MEHGNGKPGALAVETSALRKNFGANLALDGVDLRIPAGCVYGVLGPNGAGKTTAIRILATLLQPDGGSARVFGHDVVREAAEVRRHVSLTAQFASVDEDLTAGENLTLLARLLGFGRRDARARARELLAAFQLEDLATHSVATFSGGMRRRLDIAASLVLSPDLLFLDEPTTGLDPRNRNHVWAVVRAIVAEGTTVVLTTQYLEEADRLADRIAVIDHGRVIAEGSGAELKASIGADTVAVRLRDPAQREQAERLLSGSLGVPVRPGRDPGAVLARMPADGHAATGPAGERAGAALVQLEHAGIGVSSFTLGQPSLDEVFLALTGGPASETPAWERADAERDSA